MAFSLKVRNYFTDHAASSLRQAIADAGGREVYAIGILDDGDLIDEVRVVARGTDDAVPAFADQVSPGQVVIHNHPSGNLGPSEADLAVAARLGARGIGSIIVSNSVDDLYCVVEVIQVREEQLRRDLEVVEQALGPSGSIAKSLPTYEHRSQQVDMAKTVMAAFSEGKHALIEAGTGTGKSLAYLVPAITWASRTGHRVVVSTNTINLQEQLVDKDIPLLSRTLGVDFRAVLMKGRSNYVCLRKLDNLLSDPETVDEEDLITLEALDAWARETETGSYTEFERPIRQELWEKVCSESDACIRTKCPHQTACFYVRARKLAGQADILVVNHHLLLADVSVRMGAKAEMEMAVLPRYEYAVFDEAHNLGLTVQEYLGYSVATSQIDRLIRMLWHQLGGRNSRRDAGMLLSLRDRICRVDDIPQVVRQSALGRIDSSLVQNTSRAGDVLSSLVYELVAFMAEAGSSDEPVASSLRITEQLLSSDRWQNRIDPAIDSLCILLSGIGQELNEVYNELLPYEDQLDRLSPGLCQDIRTYADRARDQAATLRSIVEQEDRDFVYWMERSGQRARPNVSFKAAPAEVEERFVESALGHLQGSVFTSATLAVAGDFSYFRESLGLDALPASRMVEQVIESPFDFKNQVLLCIPTDMPEPDTEAYSRTLADVVVRLVGVSKGRAFVLFTSHRLMKACANACREELESHGYRLLVQGEGSRHHLLTTFRERRGCVLFGTDSFWEGVDVQGEALSNVVIVRLPFRVPTEPLLQAKIELMERQGRSAFTELSLPQAVIKFRQGFGRLIRSKTDRGTIVVLDSRILRRSYGSAFLRSIPECRVSCSTLDSLVVEMEEWLSEG